jgi:replicative DNA helicase
MALQHTAARKPPDASNASTPLHRTAPHNIEVEQALLGATLVNNEAFYRVSDFL